MATGVLIAESLRTGAHLTDLALTVTAIRRSAPASATTPEQAAAWTLLTFTVDDTAVAALARRLAAALDVRGWYVDLQTANETIVVFRGRVFRYPRGDPEGRREAESYARGLGIPDAQLDWPA